jgi:hypothetical protein
MVRSSLLPCYLLYTGRNCHFLLTHTQIFLIAVVALLRLMLS